MVNKTMPNNLKVSDYLATLSKQRNCDATTLIELMSKISGLEPVMWGPSIIGFGTKHYKYDTGREGDMPIISFSPRQAQITIYFNEGFDRYGTQLGLLGNHKTSVACLYINKLNNIDLDILTDMLKESFKVNNTETTNSVEQYLKTVPIQALPYLNELRQLIKEVLPDANEVISYGVIGYKLDTKRARIFVAGWHDHVSIYPVPKDIDLQVMLKPYIKGKGTIWFDINKPLPLELINKTVLSLVN
jgi:uncharacterized protein YdhG (YjbR/CyaY superfamily)